MANQFVGRYRDFDGDVKQVSVDLIPAATATEASAIGLHFNSWSAGGEGGQFFKDELQVDSGSAGTLVAQGALRIVLEMVETSTGKIFREFIPMPNLSKADDVGANPAFIVSGGLTVLNPDHADYAAMKTDLDANWQSPDGNAGTLSRAYIEE